MVDNWKDDVTTHVKQLGLTPPVEEALLDVLFELHTTIGPSLERLEKMTETAKLLRGALKIADSADAWRKRDGAPCLVDEALTKSAWIEE